MQFSARPPRDHGQTPVAHFLGKFSPGNIIVADTATESSRDKHRCHDTAYLRILSERAPLKRRCMAQNLSPASTVGTTPPGDFSETIPHRWNDTVSESSETHIPLEQRRPQFIQNSDDTPVGTDFGTDSVTLLQPSPSETTTRHN